MRRIALLALVVGLLVSLFALAPANAQASRTWVSVQPHGSLQDLCRRDIQDGDRR
jgi:uncharacterized membrane protein SpoIIM required for sporulation